MGTLQNGAETYLVRNPREAGYADFALVRQTDSDGSSFRDALCGLPHFIDGRPYDFIIRHGIECGPGGYVLADGRYETLRLSRVPVWSQEVCDSTLLLIFDAMSRSDAPQAVIISGDIDVAKIWERSNVLSLMALPLVRGKIESGVEWVQHDSMRFVSMQAGTRNAAAVRLIYSTRRTSKENMNTVLPHVTGMYAEELGNIISSRLRHSFRAAGIPLSGTAFSYKDSSRDFEDERFSLSMVVPADRLEASLELVGSVLGSLDRNGAGMRELAVAKERVIAARHDASEGSTNAEYVEKCLRAYMCGSDLASKATINSMLLRRGVQDESELNLFNDFVSALLDRENNLVLRVDVPDIGIDGYRMKTAFRNGWSKEIEDGGGLEEVRQTDIPASKVKLTGEVPEPITGGVSWTFSNGIRVIFKHESTPGEFRYALFMNGGSSSIPGIRPGESAFTEDMFRLCGGEGMDAHVSMSSFRLSGTAPSDSLQDVLRTIQTLPSRVAVNEEAFRYYVRSEGLDEDARALYPLAVNAVADSIMSPGYGYPEMKDVSSLGEDFPERAVSYFQKRLSRLNDGVLVLTGDLQPEALKKELPRVLGGFKTAKGSLSRPKVGYPMISGRIAVVKDAAAGLVGGKELGVNLCLSTRQPYDNNEIMAFRIASLVLRKELVGRMAECGYSVGLACREENYPKSSFTVYASCRPCRQDGLPSGLEIKDQLSVLSAVRNLVDSLPGVVIGRDELKAYKTLLKSAFAEEGNNTDAVMKRIEARYCEGKDLVSGAIQAIDSVTEDDVRKMLAFLVSGAGVEYVFL
ncbi:MAG: hypothetical protein MJY89_04610 [Bacteroidales bacterium]|nr:hypothetical protein [Bacteroidales bacterium]